MMKRTHVAIIVLALFVWCGVNVLIYFKKPETKCTNESQTTTQPTSKPQIIQPIEPQISSLPSPSPSPSSIPSKKEEDTLSTRTLECPNVTTYTTSIVHNVVEEFSSSISACINQTKLDIYHDDTYYLHVNESLPFLPHEYEYFSNAILHQLDPYPTLKSYIDNDCNEQSGESSIEQLTKLSSDELKHLYFTKMLNSSFPIQKGGGDRHDLHQDERLYTIRKRQFNTKQPFEITKKLSTLLVHTMFSYNQTLREDFASYPVISNRSRELYCKNGCRGHFCVICEESIISKQDSKNFYSKPWCFKSNLDYGILSIEDGIYDMGVHNVFVPGPIFDKDGNILVMSAPHALTLNLKSPLHFEPMFASVGIVYNPTAAGHFPIEALPRVVFLSYFLPLHIPILMNNVGWNRNTIRLFQENGIIHPKRRFIWGDDGHYYIGKRVYFIYSKDHFAPLTPDIVMRMTSTIYSRFYKNNYLNILKSITILSNYTTNIVGNTIDSSNITTNTNTPRREYILLIDRSDVRNRMIANQDLLIENLRNFTTPLNIDILPVQLGKLKSFLEMGATFYGAIAIIAPHGAGLANMNSVNREKIKFIMEVGWQDGWPADFYCGPRSMGVKYIAIVCKDLNFKVEIDEVMDHVKREFKDYSPPASV